MPVPYQSDPLQVIVTNRFRQDEDGWHFSISGQAGSLPVSEEDMLSAQDRLGDYSARSKAFGVIVSAAFLAATMLWVLRGAAAMWLAAPLAAAALLPLIGSMIAVALALRPLKRRLRDYARQQPGWRPKGWRRAFAEMRVSGATVALSFAIVCFLLPRNVLALVARNEAVHHGTLVDARVVRAKAGRACSLDFAYGWQGRSYRGDSGDCRLVHRYGAAATIPVRVSAARPDFAVAEGEGVWTADIAAPLIVFLLLAVIFPGLVRSARDYVPPSEDGTAPDTLSGFD